MSQKYKVYVNNTIKIIEENWQDFCSKYIMIEAAGGLVFNKDGDILMIFRNGKWDLPQIYQENLKKPCKNTVPLMRINDFPPSADNSETTSANIFTARKYFSRSPYETNGK